MATIAQIGHGSTVDFGTFTAEITSIAISSEKEELDVTHMESPDERREFIGGLLDPGELTLELNFDPDEVDPMTLGDNPIQVNWKTGAVWSWPKATCTGYEVNAPVGEQMTATATFKLSSTLTQTPA